MIILSDLSEKQNIKIRRDSKSKLTCSLLVRLFFDIEK